MLDVVVVGGGIRGLFSARRLLAEGKSVKVLERSDRIGGKLLTHWDPEHQNFVELGGMRVVESSSTILSLLKELSIPIVDFIEDNPLCPFVLSGKVRGTIKELNLGALLEAGLVTPELIKQGNLDLSMEFSSVLLNAFEKVDSLDSDMSLYDFLKKGSDPLKLCALKVLDLRNGVGGMHTIVKVGEFTGILHLHSQKVSCIAQGFDYVAQKIADDYPVNTVQLQSEVISIYQGDSEVTVEYLSKENVKNTITARCVLLAGCSLQKITFHPELPQSHIDVKNELLAGTSHAYKAALRFTKQFWEEEGIHGGTSWIGPSMINQVYFPSISSNFLLIYIRGEPAIRWIALTKEERKEKSLKCIQELFPDVDISNLFSDFHDVCWNEPGSGAYYLQGAPALQNALKPFGRIIFSTIPRGWMDDALLDATNSVTETLSILKALTN